MKTPEQIRDMEFQSSPMGGYKKADVDLFLEEVASEIEILMKQKLEADRKLQEISKKAPEMALSSAGVQNVLISAQRVAEQLTDDARNQAEAIIADANLKLTEAGIKAQEIMADAEKNASLLGKTAEAEATKIIADAVKKSQEITAAANESVDLQQKLYDRLKIEVSDFKEKSLAQCAAVMEFINQLPNEIPVNIEQAKTVLAIDFNDPQALLNSAVEEKIAKERAEAKAAAEATAQERAEEASFAAAEKEMVVEKKIAAEKEIAVEKERVAEKAEKTVEFKAIIPEVAEASANTIPIAKEEYEIPAEITENEEYQLSFDEDIAKPAASNNVKSGFAIANEEPAVKKGRISFGNDDDDDDDDDEKGFFFKRKKK